MAEDDIEEFFYVDNWIRIVRQDNFGTYMLYNLISFQTVDPIYLYLYQISLWNEGITLLGTSEIKQILYSCHFLNNRFEDDSLFNELYTFEQEEEFISWDNLHNLKLCTRLLLFKTSIPSFLNEMRNGIFSIPEIYIEKYLYTNTLRSVPFERIKLRFNEKTKNILTYFDGNIFPYWNIDEITNALKVSITPLLFAGPRQIVLEENKLACPYLREIRSILNAEIIMRPAPKISIPIIYINQIQATKCMDVSLRISDSPLYKQRDIQQKYLHKYFRGYNSSNNIFKKEGGYLYKIKVSLIPDISKFFTTRITPLRFMRPPIILNNIYNIITKEEEEENSTLFKMDNKNLFIHPSKCFMEDCSICCCWEKE